MKQRNILAVIVYCMLFTSVFSMQNNAAAVPMIDAVERDPCEICIYPFDAGQHKRFEIHTSSGVSHAYCVSCIRKILATQDTTENTIICPKCREVVTLNATQNEQLKSKLEKYVEKYIVIPRILFVLLSGVGSLFQVHMSLLLWMFLVDYSWFRIGFEIGNCFTKEKMSLWQSYFITLVSFLWTMVTFVVQQINLNSNQRGEGEFSISTLDLGTLSLPIPVFNLALFLTSFWGMFAVFSGFLTGFGAKSARGVQDIFCCSKWSFLIIFFLIAININCGVKIL